MLPGKKYQLEDILQIIKRRKWLIILPWVIGSLGTIAFAKAMQDRYRSISAIQVVPPRVPEALVKAMMTGKIEDRLPVISQQILSRTRLERIIQDFGLYAKERKTQLMEDIVKSMRADIAVEVLKGDAFSVSYVSTDARTAMKVTERVASLFVEENLRDREVLAEGANQFLDSQLDDARRRLLDHEKKLEDYRREHNGELPTQLPSNIAGIQNAQAQIAGLTDSINRDRERQLVLQRMIEDANTEGSTLAASARGTGATGAIPDSDTGPVSVQLEAAKNQLQTMLLHLKSTHPDVKNQQRRVQELEKRAEAEALKAPVSQATEAKPTSQADAIRLSRIKDMRGELESLTRQIAHKEETQKGLEATIADLRHKVDQTPTRESELTALNRDYETLQKVYTGLLSKGEEAKVAANLERRQIGEQFKVIDAARLPEKAFSPNRPQIDAIGSIVALLVGIGFVALLEVRDTSFRSDGDVVAVLSLPVLAIVPSIVTAAEAKAWQRRRRIMFACASVIVVVGGAAAFVLRSHIVGLLDGWL